jgi:hypothetical protein
MISSTMMTSLSLTLPTRFIYPILPAPSLCLMIIAKSIYSLFSTCLYVWTDRLDLLLELLGSSDTSSIWWNHNEILKVKSILKFEVVDCNQVGLQIVDRHSGTEESLQFQVILTWIYPQWRSTAITRSTPTVSRSRATSAAEIGTLGTVFRSWAYKMSYYLSRVAVVRYHNVDLACWGSSERSDQ